MYLSYRILLKCIVSSASKYYSEQSVLDMNVVILLCKDVQR